ncbi:hypothetical protein, partial [Chitinimonas sp.]|uniref:hypothetical protein n=1 Tax=Chitinimonas sp. TaxID=1934313 RepID=UPI0035ADEF60
SLVSVFFVILLVLFSGCKKASPDNLSPQQLVKRYGSKIVAEYHLPKDEVVKYVKAGKSLDGASISTFPGELYLPSLLVSKDEVLRFAIRINARVREDEPYRLSFVSFLGGKGLFGPGLLPQDGRKDQSLEFTLVGQPVRMRKAGEIQPQLDLSTFENMSIDSLDVYLVSGEESGANWRWLAWFLPPFSMIILLIRHINRRWGG